MIEKHLKSASSIEDFKDKIKTAEFKYLMLRLSKFKAELEARMLKTLLAL